MTTPRSLYIETMGCQMNALDSELVMDELRAKGYSLTDEMDDADVVVLNTCSVRQHAEDKVHSRLGELGHSRRNNPEQIVAVIGCMAERDAEGLMRREGLVDVLCGPNDLHRLPGLVEDVRTQRRPAVALSGKLRQLSTPIHHVGAHDDLESLDSGRVFGLSAHVNTPKVFGRHQAYVRITRGCNKHCTFCVVPATRGPEVHRPPDQIVGEVRRLAGAGVKEVTLLGQTVNHYAHADDRGRETSFARLLQRIHDEVPELPRLRFVTSFPRDFTEEALEVMAASPRICRYLHIPAQSGSDRVLKRMNRGHTVAAYRDLLDRARAVMPDICLSGDMIVGFCGETEEDFQASLDLLRHARYKNCFIFKYSPRPGTASDERLTDDIPDDEKRRRNNEMLAVQTEINLTNNRTLLGETVEVLVEGPSKRAIRLQDSEQARGEEVEASPSDRGQLVGRTRGDQIVVFAGGSDLIGEFVSVRIDGCTPHTLRGDRIDSAPSRASARPQNDVALAVLPR